MAIAPDSIAETHSRISQIHSFQEIRNSGAPVLFQETGDWKEQVPRCLHLPRLVLVGKITRSYWLLCWVFTEQFSILSKQEDTIKSWSISESFVKFPFNWRDIALVIVAQTSELLPLLRCLSGLVGRLVDGKGRIYVVLWVMAPNRTLNLPRCQSVA